MTLRLSGTLVIGLMIFSGMGCGGGGGKENDAVDGPTGTPEAGATEAGSSATATATKTTIDAGMAIDAATAIDATVAIDAAAAFDVTTAIDAPVAIDANANIDAGARIDTGVTLVEPLGNLSAYLSDVAIDGNGVIHAVELGSDSVLRYLTCAGACGTAASWTSTTLSPGVHVDLPLIRVTTDGRPRIVFDNFVTGEVGDYVGFCDSDCTSAGAWKWTKVVTPVTSIGRTWSHYFALAGDAMILGYGSTTPLGALVCTYGCATASNWEEVIFSDANCVNPHVAVSPSGAMVYACDTVDFNTSPTDSVEVWSCPGNCTVQSNWKGVQGLATGNGMTIDTAIAPDGRIAVAVNLGQQADASSSYGLGLVTCASNCGAPASWSGFLLPGSTLYSKKVSLDFDETGRLAVAFDGSSSYGNGLILAACASGCDHAANWEMGLFDDAKRLSTSLPLNPPSGCTNAMWMADRVNRLAFRKSTVAVTSGYGAIGIGGSCFNNLFSPTSAYTYMRSVVSFVITPL